MAAVLRIPLVFVLLVLGASCALAEANLVERHEQQALRHPDPETRQEGQRQLALDIARDPIGNRGEIHRLLEMLEKEPNQDVRYAITKVFYWMLMNIHDTQAASPIVRHLEELARSESRKGNRYLAQGLSSAAMEGKKPDVPPNQEAFDREQEQRLLDTLNCESQWSRLHPFGTP